ncbi:dual specificity protein phosphatase Mpk3 [Culicoides brevitarsis]|uniref:dual specificity protein phosphatase Mpk3 n=1 Tax=Culicoides brevitarsis TaxID=469753 RepID=UPI00307B462C
MAVPAEWLQSQLLKPNWMDFLLILDCRLQSDFIESHIKGSLNFFLPTLILRRLHQKKLDLFTTIKCRHLKNRIMSNYSSSKDGKFTFVLYTNTMGSMSAAGCDASNTNNTEINSYNVLKKILREDGCTLVTLEGGFQTFSERYPEWCENEALLETDYNPTEQLMGLRSLRISTPFSDSAGTSSTESSDCESGGTHDLSEAPVEILPWLYLGNEKNSQDLEALQKYNIRYILNVTPNLKNVFEGEITYLQIKITDHCSQDLSIHFPEAIKFIEDAHAKNSVVLVHCVAGVSRSVTITLAYLMYARSLCLNDAFSFVRAKKPDISPNFHFMQQLNSFERQLKKDPTRSSTPLSGYSSLPQSGDRRSIGRARHNKYGCNCLEFDCKCVTVDTLFGPFTGVSPDSGIEFDRWSSDNTPK